MIVGPNGSPALDVPSYLNTDRSSVTKEADGFSDKALLSGAFAHLELREDQVEARRLQQLFARVRRLCAIRYGAHPLIGQILLEWHGS
jgi:hypothetical protein